MSIQFKKAGNFLQTYGASYQIQSFGEPVSFAISPELLLYLMALKPEIEVLLSFSTMFLFQSFCCQKWRGKGVVMKPL